MQHTSKPHVNSQGASYLAINFLGWATAKTPWGALAKLDLNMSGKRVSLGSKAFSDQTKGVALYYLPDEDKFKGLIYYAPIDADGEPYGIPLYGDLSERNERIIHQNLIK